MNRLLLIALIAASLPGPSVARAQVEPVALVAHDFGPDRRLGVLRRAVDARLGIATNTEFVRLGAAVRANLFLPDRWQPSLELGPLPDTHAFSVELSIALDLRDDVDRPTRGLFAALDVSIAGGGGFSSWDFVRVSAEVRGYLPLPAGIVIAARLAATVISIGRAYGLGPETTFDLDELGPPSDTLDGGGSRSHRGFPRRALGATRRPIADVDGTPGTVVLGGGTHRWEGSLEVRVPVGRAIELALFVDVGDVSRSALDLSALNLAVGGGLRVRSGDRLYRLELAVRPPSLAGRGHRTCEDARDVECRPAATVLGFPGALHLALGGTF